MSMRWVDPLGWVGLGHGPTDNCVIYLYRLPLWVYLYSGEQGATDCHGDDDPACPAGPAQSLLVERMTDGDVALGGETEYQRRWEVLRHQVQQEIRLADNRVMQCRYGPRVLQLLYIAIQLIIIIFFWQSLAGEHRFVQPIRGKPRFCIPADFCGNSAV